MRRQGGGRPPLVGALVLVGCTVGALSLPVRRGAPRVLPRNGQGRPAFAQLRSGARTEQSQPYRWATHKELYPVDVSFDVKEFDRAGGVTMFFDKKRHRMRVGAGITAPEGLAWGRFADRINETGWSELHVETTASRHVSNDVRMYAAGFLEGLLTHARMSEYRANVLGLLMKREASAHALSNVRKQFKHQIAYLRKMTNLENHVLVQEPEEAYWKHARYILFQLWGVCDGYNYVARNLHARTLDLEDMLVLNSGGELPQMMEAYTPAAVEQRAALQTEQGLSLLQRRRAGKPPQTVGAHIREAAEQRPASQAEQGLSLLQRGHARSRALSSHPGRTVDRAALAAAANATNGDPLDDAHWEQRLAEDGRCSAFVRVAQGNTDLLIGHSTWDEYSKMTRIFKYYKLLLDGSESMATTIAFSSYPGAVSSTDDFYIMDSGLAVMETSLEVLNPAAWDLVLDFPAHQHPPNFVHVMIANRLAKGAAHWAQLFASVNTGTYTSQWMAVDYKQFRVGKPPPDDTFWVVEVVPGTLHSQDMSQFLRDRGFWPSFNRPFFDEVRAASGHAAAERSHGSLYSWGNNPRAKIFAGAAKNTNALFDMRGLMSRNAYAPTVGSQVIGPGHDISARMDLSPTRPVPNGGIDAKVTSRCLFAQMQVQAVSGPSHSVQAPFRWRGADGRELWPDWPHAGLPNVWEFDFVQMTPRGAGKLLDGTDC